MKFQNIPVDDISVIKVKYNQEILRIVQSINKESQKLIAKKVCKLLKQDLTTIYSYGIKITDLFQSKKISFGVFVNEIISLNQLEISMNIKESLFEEFSDFHQDLINYLKIEILEKIFSDFLLCDRF